jgi:hypothetical protein
VNDSTVRLQGITSSPNKEIKEVVVEQVIKWDRGNDLWAVVLVEPAEKIIYIV